MRPPAAATNPSTAPPAGHRSPSNAGARAEAWELGARRLTVRSLSVPPLWFSMQVYTVEPGGREEDPGCASRSAGQPLGTPSLHDCVTGGPQKASPCGDAATTQRAREGRAGPPVLPCPEEEGSGVEVLSSRNALSRDLDPPQPTHQPCWKVLGAGVLSQSLRGAQLAELRLPLCFE